MHVVRAVLGHAQPPVVGEEEVHLGRGLGLGGVLEDDPHPIDDEFLAGLGDLLGGGQQAGRGGRNGLAEAGVDMGPGPGREQRAELIGSPPGHGRPGHHVLEHRFAQEVFGGDDAHLTVGDRLGRGDAEHAAEMVGVAVGVDHRPHRSLSQRGVGEVETRPGGGLGREWIDHDPAGVTLDETDVRDVVASGLPELGRHLEQAMGCIALGLTPQARVYRVGHLGGVAYEVVAGRVPGRWTTRTARQDRAVELSDQTTNRQFVVDGVERQLCGGTGEHRQRVLGRWLGLR